MNKTIRIRLIDGAYYDTERYTFDQLTKLRADGADVEIGGLSEFGGTPEPRRVIAQSRIAEFSEL